MKRKQSKKTEDLNEESVESSGTEGSEPENIDENPAERHQGVKRSRKKPKLNSRKLYKQPTAEELNNLNEAETLFHSSLFKLQTTELLKEVKLKPKWKSHFNKWLLNFKDALANIPQSETFQINDVKWSSDLETHVPLRLGENHLEFNGVFKFVPPTNVEVGVSYQLETSLGPNVKVDVILEVPKECWQHGDSLNHRYLLKRAQYLTYIAGYLKNNELIEEMSYNYIDGDENRPTLCLKPNGKAGKHFHAQLIPVPASACFKLNRFIPQRNNIRPSWFYGKTDDDIPETSPTPHYNLSILKDLTLQELTEHFKNDFEDSDGIRDGILLLKVWLHQRNLSISFNNFALMLLISYLIKNRKIFKLMSSYQVLRSVLVALSQSKWNEEGLLFNEEENNDANCPTLKDFHDAFEVVFIDPTGYYNLCGNMSEGNYLNLKHEANLSTRLLNSNSTNSFDALFMTPVPFHVKFDTLIHIKDKHDWKKVISDQQLKKELLNYSGSSKPTVSVKIYDILKRGLGQRALLITPKPPDAVKWKINEKAPNCNSTVTFGVLLNQEYSNGILEKGPQANTAEASEFRTFWGDKADLRRFQDGTICEAVLWPADCLAAQRGVTEQIVKYLLQRFLKVTTIKFTNSQLDSLLSVANIRLPKEMQAYGTGEEASLAVIRSFDSLSKQLRKLDSLPLPISGIQGISPVFRYAEVFPSLPTNFRSNLTQNRCALVNKDNSKCPPFVACNDVIIQMENSGKWPEDLDALLRVKAAFYVKLAELLSGQYYLTTNVYPTHVDVVKDGFVFRLVIACRKEINLMRQYKTPDGMIKNRVTEESLELEYKTESLPQLTSALHGLQQQYPLFSSVSRLAKRWIASQLLSYQFPEVVVELLVAHLFLDSSPFIPPSSTLTGFIRFLSLLAKFDWKTNVLILNLNDKFSKDDLSEILTWFTTNRTTLPPMCIVTPYERHKSIWSTKMPQGPVLHRTTLLAKAAFDQLSSQINSPDNNDYKLIFRPSLDVYDVIIHLNADQNPKLCYSVNPVVGCKPPSCENYLRSGDEVLPVVNFDTVALYIRDLKAMYDQFAIFFHDNFGGNYIGVIWKPKAFEARPFKVMSANGRKPNSGSMEGLTTMLPDVEAILEDFALLGTGLVKCIKTKSEKWAV